MDSYSGKSATEPYRSKKDSFEHCHAALEYFLGWKDFVSYVNDDVLFDNGNAL